MFSQWSRHVQTLYNLIFNLKWSSCLGETCQTPRNPLVARLKSPWSNRRGFRSEKKKLIVDRKGKVSYVSRVFQSSYCSDICGEDSSMDAQSVREREMERVFGPSRAGQDYNLHNVPPWGTVTKLSVGVELTQYLRWCEWSSQAFGMT